ncbi:MAG: sulfurtransferase TusA family protein [Zoogloeaceae bacterium]|jgi:sulfite reductase (ferredoxin)|nr:sulfurtransferase TusA family protein [Zoogloeaceae bacterium]
MSTGYVIPRQVLEDTEVFRQQHADYLAGRLDALAFKTLRVPFGIYEQRESDTFMLRVKLTGGLITPAQLSTLAELSETWANGKLHVTTRGGIQLHYVQADHFLPIIEALHQSGLTGRGGGGNTVRNIVVDPYAGIAPDEVFDVTPHALAMTEKMLAQKDSYALPRKFKIAFSGSRADRGTATLSDVGFIASIQKGQKGFCVYVAGGMGAHSRLGRRFMDFLPEGEIFLLAQAIKEVFDAKGNRRNKHAARLRFLVDELGLETFRALVEEKIVNVRARGNWEIALQEGFSAPPLSGQSREASTLSPDERLWQQRFATPQKQAGYYALKVPLSLGDLPAAKARTLARALRELAPHEETIRFAGDQNLYLRNLTAANLRTLRPILEDLSPLMQKPALLGDIVVCTGAATCQLGITVPRGAQLALEKRNLPERLDLDAAQGLKIHLSGCPNSCGKHEIADLGFFGKASRNNGVLYPAYNVFVGAKIGEGATRFARKVGEVAAIHLPDFVEKILSVWIPLKPQFASFADWIDHGGEAIVTDLAQAFAKVPAFEDDKNPYFDFQAKDVFSLKGRGAGECSAGMYDLIEADRKALVHALKAEATPENLTAIRLLAARMLLVTRGEEAREEAEVLRAFKKQFLDSGLIDAAFAPLLEGEARPEVKELAEAVIALYGTMDNTLKFAVEQQRAQQPATGVAEAILTDNTLAAEHAQAIQAAPPPAPKGEEKGEDETVHRFKDYRGVACPMNFVKTKMDLAQMQSGEILEIVLDDGAPIDNVPQSVKSEGHTVLEQTRKGEVWHVKIQKK